MAEADPLMIQFLSWVAARRRTYNESMDAWQSHCPRQTIWEDAIIEGFVELSSGRSEHDPDVILTVQGKSVLGQIDGR